LTLTSVTTLTTPSLSPRSPRPELQILGITTTFGDTETRAKLLDRFLAEVGTPGHPCTAGVATPPKAPSQRRYAENNRFARPSHPDPSLPPRPKFAATPAKSPS